MKSKKFKPGDLARDTGFHFDDIFVLIMDTYYVNTTETVKVYYLSSGEILGPMHCSVFEHVKRC